MILFWMLSWDHKACPTSLTPKWQGYTWYQRCVVKCGVGVDIQKVVAKIEI